MIHEYYLKAGVYEISGGVTINCVIFVCKYSLCICPCMLNYGCGYMWFTCVSLHTHLLLNIHSKNLCEATGIMS